MGCGGDHRGDSPHTSPLAEASSCSANALARAVACAQPYCAPLQTGRAQSAHGCVHGHRAAASTRERRHARAVGQGRRLPPLLSRVPGRGQADAVPGVLVQVRRALWLPQRDALTYPSHRPFPTPRYHTHDCGKRIENAGLDPELSKACPKVRMPPGGCMGPAEQVQSTGPGAHTPCRLVPKCEKLCMCASGPVTCHPGRTKRRREKAAYKFREEAAAAAAAGAGAAAGF